MPRTATEAKPPQGLALLQTSPASFAALVLAGYLLLCLPILALKHFDASVFVNAGDRYVNAAQTTPGLRVKPQSNGYDGQFYYRMAVRPFSLAPVEDGISFDHPAKRAERFLYPLLAWVVSFGQAGAVAWAMFGLNLLGIGAIAYLACDLARRLRLPLVLPLAIVLWPGFIVTVLHDTTEITSTAFLLGAVSAYLADRLVVYVVLAAAATLARETTLPVFCGILVYEAAMSRWRRAGLCLLALVLFGVWREILAGLAREAPQAQGLAQDIGWPFLGLIEMLRGCVTGARSWASTPFKDHVIRGIVLLTAPPIVVFCGLVAARLRKVFLQPGLAAIGAGWALTAILMTLLTANGPWVDPIAYFRAFTDCFVIGCVLLFASGFTIRLSWLGVFGACQTLLIWALCMFKLR